MRRKIYNIFEMSENANGSVAIMIDGARRVGKSYIVEDFARLEYNSTFDRLCSCGRRDERVFIEFQD